MTERLSYHHRYRRLVLDMHIPDWDPGLLAKFDAEQIADRLLAGRINYATVYAQSCTGHCYWPTEVGKAHNATRQRDLFGSLVAALRQRDIFACAYYSLVFNNLIADYPDWRIRSTAEATLEDDYGTHRYGQACPNNTDYRAMVSAELHELLQRYEFDGMFFDMAFWRPICMCPACLSRYRAETGKEIPTVIDWHNVDWCRYQQVRERWNYEFQADITALVKGLRPGMPVTHNAGGLLHGWSLAVDLNQVDCNDFLSGDFYGDISDQRTFGKLVSACTLNQPAEIMTTRCLPDATEHVQTKDEDLLSHMMAAIISTGAAASIIDGINPDGSQEPAIYDMIGRVYQPIEALETHLGGTPLADVGLYFSDYSKMNFADDGKAADTLRWGEQASPHQRALRGACEKLQRAQVPFAIVTRRQLTELSRYRVLVLPNVLRMTAEEIEAIRRYVAAGGRLYASHLTSLNDTDGRQFDDFALADLFGCHYAGAQPAVTSYLRPAPSPYYDDVLAALAPQRYLVARNTAYGPHGMLKLQQVAGQVLALRTTSLYEEPGSVVDQHYISLHSSPPWTDTSEPLIVHQHVGRGEVIYSAADIETVDAPAAGRVWLSLIERLADQPWTLSVATHPCVWSNAFHQAERRRVLLLFVNYSSITPALPVPSLSFTLQPITTMPYRRLVALPSGNEIPSTRTATGAISGELLNLNGLQAVVAEY